MWTYLTNFGSHMEHPGQLVFHIPNCHWCGNASWHQKQSKRPFLIECHFHVIWLFEVLQEKDLRASTQHTSYYIRVSNLPKLTKVIQCREYVTLSSHLTLTSHHWEFFSVFQQTCLWAYYYLNQHMYNLLLAYLERLYKLGSLQKRICQTKNWMK